MKLSNVRTYFIRTQMKLTKYFLKIFFNTVWYGTVNEKSKTGILIDFGLKIFLRVRVFVCYRKIDENDCTFVRTLLKTLSFIRGEYSPNCICMFVPFFL